MITGTTGDDGILVFDSGNLIKCDTACTVTGPVTGPISVGSQTHWTIDSGAGDGVDDKYKINGNGGSDRIIFHDGSATDNDKIKIENVDRFEYFDGSGKDKLDFKG